MDIIISGIHLKHHPEMELYAKKRVEKLAKINARIEKIWVRLIEEKSHRGQENDYYCEITVQTPGSVLEIVDSEREIDKAIDRATERMKRLMVKTKEKKISKLHSQGVRSRSKY